MKRYIYALCAAMAWTYSAPDLAAAQNSRAASATSVAPAGVAVSQSTTPASPATPIRVIGAYRPVDPAMRSSSDTNTVQTGLDLYFELGGARAVVAGQRFEVFRDVSAPNSPSGVSLRLKVGEVKILSIQGPVAIGRVVGGPEIASAPFLRSPGILIGDFVDPTRPIAPIAKPKKRWRKRKQLAKTAPCPAPKTSAPQKNEVAKDQNDDDGGAAEALDPDDFRSWDARPIDF